MRAQHTKTTGSPAVRRTAQAACCCLALGLITLYSSAPAQSPPREPNRPGPATRRGSEWRSFDRRDATPTTPARSREPRDPMPLPDESIEPPAAGDDFESAAADTESNPPAPAPDRTSDPRFQPLARSGQAWREYNLAPFTGRLPAVTHPEQAVVDWVLRQTGTETWHGEEIAVLSATRSRLRVMHRPEVLDQVSEIVDRFTRPVQHQVSMRVQVVATSDLKWRQGLLHLLKPAATGPDGQHVWLIAPEDAALVRNRLRADWSAAALNQRVLAANGIPTALETGRPVNFISSLELTSGLYLAYQPVVGRLHEGVQLQLAPLWTVDGDAVDLDLRLETRVLSRLHYTQGAAPLQSTTQEALVQVPEVAATRLDVSLRWPTSRVLLISAGARPASGGQRRGPFQLAAPVEELLIMAEIDAPAMVRTPNSRDSMTR